MKKNYFILLCMFIGMHVYAADVYVSASYSGSDANGSQTKPYKELFTALSQANSGDVIHVTAGKYLPQIDAINGARYSTFTIDKSISIIGGYSSDFSVNEPATYPTILSGDIDNNDYYGIPSGSASGNENNAYHVVTVNIDNTLSLEGLTVQGGNANLNDVTDKPKSQNGGGIFSLGALELENVIITGNASGGKPGAGIYSNAGIIANKVAFLGNITGNDGGGLYVKDGIANIKNCMFIGNESNSGGGALMIGGTTSSYISNNTFYWNVTARYGTCSLYSSANTTSVVLVNNTFVNNDITNSTNKSNGGGGGVYVNWGGNVYLVNNTIMGNKTLDGTDVGEGGAVYSRAGNLFMANNVIAGNYSATGGDDVFLLTGTNTISSLGYNMYGYGGISGTIGGSFENDIVLGTSKSSSLDMLAQQFEGSATSYLFEATTEDNGGPTETVKLLNSTLIIAPGKTIACLPLSQVSETTLNVDLNNDGDKEDNLTIDQRGFARNLSGNACIGAYEYTIGTDIESNKIDNSISLRNRQIDVNLTNDYTCSIYDVSGKIQFEINKVASDKTTSLFSLPKGIYIVRVKSQKDVFTKKIIL